MHSLARIFSQKFSGFVCHSYVCTTEQLNLKGICNPIFKDEIIILAWVLCMFCFIFFLSQGSVEKFIVIDLAL